MVASRGRPWNPIDTFCLPRSDYIHLKYIASFLANLKSPWYHWYQGRRLVALAGMGLGLGVTGLFVTLTAGFGLFPLVLMLALDHVLIVLIALYVLVRFSLPGYLPLAFVDWFLVKQVMLIALPGILITRACTLGVATLAGRGRVQVVSLKKSILPQMNANERK
jgi:hypothetical protein